MTLHDMGIPGLDDTHPQVPAPQPPAAEPYGVVAHDAPTPAPFDPTASAATPQPSHPANIPRLEDLLLPDHPEHTSRRNRRKAEEEAAAAAEYAARQARPAAYSAPTLEPDAGFVPPPDAPPAPPAYDAPAYDAPPAPPAYDAPAYDAPPAPPAYDAPAYDAPPAPPAYDAPAYEPPAMPPAYDAPPAPPAYDAPSADTPAADFPELGSVGPYGRDPQAPEAGAPATPAMDDLMGAPTPFSIDQPPVAPVAGFPAPPEPAAPVEDETPAPASLHQDITPGFGNDYAPIPGGAEDFTPAPAFGDNTGFGGVPTLEEDPEPVPTPEPPPPSYDQMPPPVAPDLGWEAAGAQAVGYMGQDPDFGGYSPQAYEMAPPPPPMPDESEIEAEVTTAAFSELSSLAYERPKVERTRAGLTKREKVPEAQQQDLGDGSIKPAERDADAVRSRYASFYSGTNRAKEDAVHTGQKVPGHAGGEV